MKNFMFGITLAIGILAYIGIPHSDAVIADERRADLAAIFNRDYQQYVDAFGNVSRTAFDPSGRVIGTQVGTYRPGEPNGMTIEVTYLQPDAEHPLGRAFDGAGKPVPLH
jgi:type II secretory pathway pseudopilin PulG